jgi:hypothetical protein
VAAIAGAAVVIAGVVGIALLSSGSSRHELRMFQGAAVPSPVEPGVRPVDTSPLKLIPDVTLWTDTELFLFGSSDASVEAVNVGLLYNPETGVWREIAAPPFDLLLKGAIGVWAEDSAVILGMECGPESRLHEAADRELNRCIPGTLAAARYRLTTNSWERIGVPEVKRENFGDEGFEDVGEAVGWAGHEARFAVGARVVGYSITNGTWRSLPDPPSFLLCTVGGRTVSSSSLVGRRLTDDSVAPDDAVFEVAGVEAWVFDETTGSWCRPPAAWDHLGGLSARSVGPAQRQ